MTYDYIIIGAGAAGLHLALSMQAHPSWGNKRVLLVDKSEKSINDKTWSFWEVGNGKWDDVIQKKWDIGMFHGPSKSKRMSLHPYVYKTLRSIEFYAYAKKILNADPRFTWVKDNIEAVEETDDSVKVLGNNDYYIGTYVFDSRIPTAYGSNHCIELLQHFKGWFVQSENPVFNPDEFLMMDYRHVYEETTSFMYILPFSETEALVEYTFFSHKTIELEIYDRLIREYLTKYLSLETYEIKEEEYGVIPMTTFPFHKQGTKRIMLIGTAGSWVKPSSGYSFKNAERYSEKVVENILNGHSPKRGLFKNRFRFYDGIFLDVLHSNNELGPGIFQDMYLKNSSRLIFEFLDEKTTLLQDIKIMSSFKMKPFTQALLRQI